jgi:hypothetical protein
MPRRDYSTARTCVFHVRSGIRICCTRVNHAGGSRWVIISGPDQLIGWSHNHLRCVRHRARQWAHRHSLELHAPTAN